MLHARPGQWSLPPHAPVNQHKVNITFERARSAKVPLPPPPPPLTPEALTLQASSLQTLGLGLPPPPPPRIASSSLGRAYQLNISSFADIC